MLIIVLYFCFFFKQKTAYEMRISDWSSDVCSSDLHQRGADGRHGMSAESFRIGFLPLVDAALPILARELGFAAREGVEIELVRDMTWATVRDRLLLDRKSVV